MKRTYSFIDNCRDYKRRKVEMKVQEKAYEDLKNVFVEQHREVQKRQEKYQATLHTLKDCKQEGLTEPRDPKRVKKLVSLARCTKRAELKYRMAVNSAENKLSLLQRAHSMYERSWLDFQRCESVSLEKWSVDDNNNMRHVTGVAKYKTKEPS